MSVEMIRSVEAGRRQPGQAALLSLIHALGIPREDANRILLGAGYAADWGSILRQRYSPANIDDLRQQADALMWPGFVTNESFDIVYANPVAQRIFGVDLATDLTGFGERNIIGRAADEEFAARFENWDEVVTFMCGLVKGDSEWGSADFAHPAPSLRRPLERLLQGTPGRVKRFVALWQAAPAIPNQVRHIYYVRFRYREHVLRFTCRINLADIFGGVHWNEWIPADSGTWDALSRMAGQ
jgi:PAS domain-containing protein